MSVSAKRRLMGVRFEPGPKGLACMVRNPLPDSPRLDKAMEGKDAQSHEPDTAHFLLLLESGVDLMVRSL
jgi:hypothetical protein